MNRLSDIIVVGLTGQSGSGKTTVSEVFADNGFAVINADKISRMVMDNNLDCISELALCFGSEIINSDGTLNRKRLAAIVFNDKEKLKMLGGITYPYITWEILNKIYEYADKGEKYVLLDAPTLFESHADDFCQLIISVSAEKAVRSRRIAERDGLTQEEINQRFSSQLTDKYFRQHSDFVIINNKTKEKLIDKARDVSEKIKGYYNHADSAEKA